MARMPAVSFSPVERAALAALITKPSMSGVLELGCSALKSQWLTIQSALVFSMQPVFKWNAKIGVVGFPLASGDMFIALHLTVQSEFVALQSSGRPSTSAPSP